MTAGVDSANSAKSGRKSGLILGLDLGGTKILGGVVNPYNKVIAHAKRKTPFASNQRVLTDDIIGVAEEAMRNAGIAASDLRAVGMGSPGPLNPDTGVVLRTGNIAMRNYPIGQILSKHFGVPATIDNDVNMACFGEVRAGAGRGCKNVIGIWVGTGVGGGIIRDGEIVHGANRNAAEIGHIIMDVKSHLKDRARGTLETESSKNGIAAYIARRIKRGAKSRLKKEVEDDATRLRSSDLAKAWRKGDKVAVAAVEHSALYCGLSVANFFNLLSPELFILGGGVMEAIGPAYLKMVKRIADEYAYTTELAKIRIVPAELGDDSAILGAAIAAREKLR